MQNHQTNAIDRAAGKALRLERERLGLSQAKLAVKVEVSYQQIQKYERGINRISLSTLVTIERKAGVRARKIFNAAINKF